MLPLTEPPPEGTKMYLITYVPRRGGDPLTVNAPGYDEGTATVMADALAALTSRVTLSQVDSEGIHQTIARWSGGQRRRRVSGNGAPPVVIEHDDTEPPYGADEPDELTEADADDAAELADESETYNAYCVKCKAKRDFHGEVVETSNGRRMAKGICPVCGTKVNAILKNLPHDEQESFHTPDDEPAEDTAVDEVEEFDAEEIEDESPDAALHALARTEGRRGIRYTCECGQWGSQWVKSGTGAEAQALAQYSEHAAGDDEDDAQDTDVDEDVDASEEMEMEDAEDSADTVSEVTDEDAGAAAAADAITVEVPPGTNVADAAEAVQAVAVEFSHAAEEAARPAPSKRARKAQAAENATPAKKATPAKRTTAAAKGADGRTENQRAAANPKKGKCPACGEKVDIIQRAGLDIYVEHPDPSTGSRCKYSTTVVGSA